MAIRSHSFEASLLFKARVTSDPARLADDIAALAASHDVVVRSVRESDGICLLMACDRVQILVAASGTALPRDHFLEALRPAAADLAETEILRRLTGHGSSMTVLVMDSDGMRDAPGQQALKRDLCWDLTDLLHTLTAPELVFWYDTDTLYAGEEFERACNFLDAQDRPAATRRKPKRDRVPAHFTRDPVISDQAMAWMNALADTPVAPGPEPDRNPGKHRPRRVARPRPRRSGAAALDLALSLTLPNRVVIGLDRLRETLDGRQALRGLAMGCSSATVGISGLANMPGLF